MGSCGKPKQLGFSLIEILVAVLLLGTGLLGYSMLQSNGIRDNQDAYLRSQASLLAYEMADRIRANANYWKSQIDPDDSLTAISNSAEEATEADHYFCSHDDPAGGDGVGELPGTCTPDEMAKYDAYHWLQDIEKSLPNGNGTLSREIDTHDSNNGFVIQILVSWDRSNSNISNIASPSVSLKVRL